MEGEQRLGGAGSKCWRSSGNGAEASLGARGLPAQRQGHLRRPMKYVGIGVGREEVAGEHTGATLGSGRNSTIVILINSSSYHLSSVYYGVALF